MLDLFAKEFLKTWSELLGARDIASKRRGKTATQTERDFLAKMLCNLNGYCNYMELPVSAGLSRGLLDWIKDQGNHRVWKADGSYTMPKEPPLPDFETVYKYLSDIIQNFNEEIKSIRLAIAPRRNAQLLNNEKLFGVKVFDIFPEIREDIQNAGNCVALGLNNAAVFYLMCVSEYALRKFANDLGVSVVNKSTPVEMGTWNEVISGLQKEIDKRFSKTDVAAQKRLALCSSMLIEFRAIELLWRNKVMHARVKYNDLEAENAFIHVERFMKALADL